MRQPTVHSYAKQNSVEDAQATNIVGRFRYTMMCIGLGKCQSFLAAEEWSAHTAFTQPSLSR